MPILVHGQLELSMASVLKQSAASGCSENTFGPASCYREFDFTLTFEQAVLSIIPSAVLLLITPLRLLYLSTKPPTTVCGQNAIFKFVRMNRAIRESSARKLIQYRLLLHLMWLSSWLWSCYGARCLSKKYEQVFRRLRCVSRIQS